MFTTESKSQLAKLLATENVQVEHRQVPTAYFDLKTRTIVCPIWKNMDGSLYDLLMGHEVGHALYTPAEGWHNAIKNNVRSNFKSFLNVLEDARIEKKMKRKFPGLTLSFREGYRHLRAENFFGVKDLTIADLPLIDRLNLFAKGGNLLESQFTSEEHVYVDRMESLETWDDVVALAEELYEKAKDEAKTDMSMKAKWDEDDQSEDGDGELSAFTDIMDQKDGEGNDGDEGEGGDEGEDGDEDGEDNEETAGDESGGDSATRPDPTSQTDDYFRRQEKKLVADESLQLTYVTLPTANLNQLIVPYKQTTKVLREYYANTPGLDDQLREFLDQNNTYISLLAKEFEMKKAATIYKKSKRANTGDLNVNHLYRYKLLDDVIFKKRTKVYKGKSHGIVLLLDKSGSMNYMVNDATEQLLILAMFCRKVNIPFVAYSFIGAVSEVSDRNKPYWNYQPGDVVMGSQLSLREIVNSTVSAGEFLDILKYQLALARSYSKYDGVPFQEHLGNTPLNESLVAMDGIIKQFRQRHRVDLAHLIIVQDGQSDGNRYMYAADGNRDMILTNDVILKDRESRMTWRTNDGLYRGMTAVLLKWLKSRTGVEIFGLYVVPTGRHSLLRDAFFTMTQTKHGGMITEQQYTQAKDILKTDRYYESYSDGYTRFSFVQSQRGHADESLDSLLPPSSATNNKMITKARIGTAFTKMFRKKSLNRVMATKFIPLLAEGV